MSALTLPRPTLERLADATRTPLPWHRPVPPAVHEPVPRLLADALVAFGSPEVLVELDLVVRGGGRLRSWQRQRGDRVTLISAAGPQTLVLAWCSAPGWGEHLAQAATVDPPDTGRPPPGDVDVPFEALIAGRAGSRLSGSGGRLRVTVAGPRGVGWVSWVLYADGWRELTPYAERGVPMVHVRAVTPGVLGHRVARLAAGARR